MKAGRRGRVVDAGPLVAVIVLTVTLVGCGGSTDTTAKSAAGTKDTTSAARANSNPRTSANPRTGKAKYPSEWTGEPTTLAVEDGGRVAITPSLSVLEPLPDTKNTFLLVQYDAVAVIKNELAAPVTDHPFGSLMVLYPPANIPGVAPCPLQERTDTGESDPLNHPPDQPPDAAPGTVDGKPVCSSLAFSYFAHDPYNEPQDGKLTDEVPAGQTKKVGTDGTVHLADSPRFRLLLNEALFSPDRYVALIAGAGDCRLPGGVFAAAVWDAAGNLVPRDKWAKDGNCTFVGTGSNAPVTTSIAPADPPDSLAEALHRDDPSTRALEVGPIEPGGDTAVAPLTRDGQPAGWAAFVYDPTLMNSSGQLGAPKLAFWASTKDGFCSKVRQEQIATFEASKAVGC